VDLNAISMSKNESTATTIAKYDVEAAIDEIQNTDEESVFKYDFTILSDPKNVRLSIDGIARIHGDSIERDEILTKDENEIPKILTTIYQELFPTFFLLSKTLNVSCPPHNIGKMGETPSQETPESEIKQDTDNEKMGETPSQETPESEIKQDTDNEIVENISESETKQESVTDEAELETPNTSQ
jgi:hypothetical protein